MTLPLHVPSETQGETIHFPPLVSINPLALDRAPVRVQVLRDHYCPHRECLVMEWETRVIWNDLGPTSGTSSDSSHTEDLMLDLGPQATAITAI